MKRYKLNIKLTDGREVRSFVVARNQADALRRLENTPQFVDFINESPADIASVEIQPTEIEAVDGNRFVVSAVENKPGWYVVADLDNRIKIEFKKGRYNDTQKVSFIGDAQPPDELRLATALREIGEHLFDKFRELI